MPTEAALTPPRAGDCHLWVFQAEHLPPRLAARAGWPDGTAHEPSRPDPRTASRAIQRLLIARYLAMDPRTLRVERTCTRCRAPHGRPFVRNGVGLDFSVTHGGTVLAIACTVGGVVGLDVEPLDNRSHAATARRVLTAREHGLLERQQRFGLRGAFHRLWTKKEAVVKLTGHGLGLGLGGFDVSAPDGVVRCPHPVAGWPTEPIHVRNLDIDGSHVAGLALTGTSQRVVLADGDTALRRWMA